MGAVPMTAIEAADIAAMIDSRCHVLGHRTIPNTTTIGHTR